MITMHFCYMSVIFVTEVRLSTVYHVTCIYTTVQFTSEGLSLSSLSFNLYDSVYLQCSLYSENIDTV